MSNRYAALESHADAGLGLDEPDVRRFTRPCERIDPEVEASRVPVDDSRVEVGDATGMHLDGMLTAIDDGHRANLESEIAEGWRAWETMSDSAERDALRDSLWSLEDRADALEHSRADRPGQENGPGSAATDSEAQVSNPTKEQEN
ncbi:hypothetical protein [Gordonia sp. WA4-43]|uniref:hypothetical protein n=1 Tax=Gordonia sp. WA4-43 TaxID=2878678 RepID=UPI001CFB7503|nr:hypothetical protein [Gordonia sp. WA4-43]UCZ89863.1 hypothetical protein LEL84_23145 [Gordonia sp. WA4-43]